MALMASGRLCLARRCSVRYSTMSVPMKNSASSTSRANSSIAGTMRAEANWRSISWR